MKLEDCFGCNATCKELIEKNGKYVKERCPCYSCLVKVQCEFSSFCINWEIWWEKYFYVLHKGLNEK